VTSAYVRDQKLKSGSMTVNSSWAAIGWSYDLLEESARVVYALLDPNGGPNDVSRR
jgi:hypothetical protein